MKTVTVDSILEAIDGKAAITLSDGCLVVQKAFKTVRESYLD